MMNVARFRLTNLLCMGEIKIIGSYRAKPRGKSNHKHKQANSGLAGYGLLKSIHILTTEGTAASNV